MRNQLSEINDHCQLSLDDNERYWDRNFFLFLEGCWQYMLGGAYFMNRLNHNAFRTVYFCQSVTD